MDLDNAAGIEAEFNLEQPAGDGSVLLEILVVRLRLRPDSRDRSPPLKRKEAAKCRLFAGS
jgi:hypothetical protein